jgi:hypothetical protein
MGKEIIKNQGCHKKSSGRKWVYAFAVRRIVHGVARKHFLG